MGFIASHEGLYLAVRVGDKVVIYMLLLYSHSIGLCEASRQ